MGRDTVDGVGRGAVGGVWFCRWGRGTVGWEGRVSVVREGWGTVGGEGRGTVRQ